MRFALVLLAACATPTAVAPTAPQPLPAHAETMIDTTPKERRRMVAPEVYLRAYLTWFGGLVPLDVQQRARPKGLFDACPLNMIVRPDMQIALGHPPAIKPPVPLQVRAHALPIA